MAKSWEISDDGLTYKFKLRDDVKFHNGEKLTADDVLYTVDRMLQPERAAVNTSWMDVIAGAQDVLDGKAKTVEGKGIIIEDDYNFSIILTNREEVVKRRCARGVPKLSFEGNEVHGGEPMSQGTNWLLQISVGPVQEFIAAARRTRDLWFGSSMLSEISKAAAKAVKDAGAELIFPEPNGDLRPKSDLNVANVILARASGDDQAMNALAERAREAAVARFKAFAAEAFKKAECCIVKERWDRQIEDVIEFYAAWTELGTGEGAYKVARQKVARLLAARKNLRDFLPHEGEFGVPKSSLDGLRESVFKECDNH